MKEWTNEPFFFASHNHFTAFWNSGFLVRFTWVAGKVLSLPPSSPSKPNSERCDVSPNGLKDWMRQLEAHGFQPDITSFNALISGYAQMADVDGALEAFKKMIQRKISPNSVSYKIVTWRLEKNRKRSRSSHIVTLHWSGCFMFFSMSIQAHLLCGPILGGTILKMWTKSRSMRESSFEFHHHSKRNSVGFGTNYSKTAPHVLQTRSLCNEHLLKHWRSDSNFHFLSSWVPSKSYVDRLPSRHHNQCLFWMPLRIEKKELIWFGCFQK